MITVERKASGQNRTWTFLWLKRVEGWNRDRHCIRSFIGEHIYLPKSGPDWTRQLAAAPGHVFYLCGGGAGYARNLHVPFEFEDGAEIVVEGWTGDTFRILNGKRLEFDDRAARELEPQRGPAFLTCRNYQFAAHYFGRRGG